MNSLTLRQRLARLISGNAGVARRVVYPNYTPESMLTSFELYALEHSNESKKLNAYCKSNPKTKSVLARYEAVQSSPDRTTLGSVIQDAEQDGPMAVRRELMRLMRWFEKNNATVQKILDLLDTNVVGTGINPSAVSVGSEWNKLALEWWNHWILEADIGGRFTMYQLQSAILRAMALDGEIFVHLTSDPDTGRPRLALIEAHRVTSLRAQLNDYQRTLLDIDGVLIDRVTGKPRFYVVQTYGESLARVIAAQNIIHVYEPSRVNQYRGISMFHAVTQILHDQSDLQKFEMQAAKAASVTAFIIKTPTGEAPEGIIGTDNLSTTTDAEGKTQFYARQFGAAARILQTGDSCEQSQSNRPNPAMRDFWQYLDRLVCRGVGNSSAGLLDYEGGWGGAALRGAITCDNRFYAVRSQSLNTALDSIWSYVIGWAVDNAELTGQPALWNRPRWQPPRRATVDIGRESGAIINELKAGLRTYQDIYGEGGADSVERLTKKADEAAFIYKLAEERGIPPQAIASLDAGERNAAIQTGAILEKQAGDTGTTDATVSQEATDAIEKVQPALIDKIGIDGTQALISILQQVSTGVLPREQGIATVKLLFGISEAEAASMVPARGTADPIADAQNIPTA